MAAILRNWKKFVAISCTHGHLIDWESFGEVVNFANRYKAQTRVHLGDFIDTAAFRGGAKGTSDESVNLTSDLNAGLECLKAYRPTHLINGNHDIRLWESLNSPSAIRVHAAQSLINDIEKLTRKLRCEYHKDYDQRRPGIVLGDILFTHGFMFGEQAVRDHAETFATVARKTVMGHIHTVQQAAGRQFGGSFAYSVGYLGQKDKFDYAKKNRSLHRWNHGVAFGEYCENDSQVWLIEKPKNGWRFPL